MLSIFISNVRSLLDMQAFELIINRWRGVEASEIKTGVPYVATAPACCEGARKVWLGNPAALNADYNRHLKALGQMAGIKTRLHSRPAYLCHLDARTDIPIEHVRRKCLATNITQTDMQRSGAVGLR